MTTELWAVGAIEYQGQIINPYEFVVVSPWDSSAAIPPISIGQYFPNGGRPFNHYNDGLGGIFGGRGWTSPPSYYVKNSGIDPAQQYDCINGGCIPKTTYSTTGKYASLAACQSGCAKDSNCTGECVSVAELAALQQAANNLQTKFCK